MQIVNKPPKWQGEIIDALEALLQQAKDGQVHSLLAIANIGDGMIQYYRYGGSADQIIGRLYIMMSKIAVSDWDDD